MRMSPSDTSEISIVLSVFVYHDKFYLSPVQFVIEAYQRRGRMENHNKKAKYSSMMEMTDHSTFQVNQCRLIMIQLASIQIQCFKTGGLPSRLPSVG